MLKSRKPGSVLPLQSRYKACSVIGQLFSVIFNRFVVGLVLQFSINYLLGKINSSQLFPTLGRNVLLPLGHQWDLIS